jgi:hypothetical protein
MRLTVLVRRMDDELVAMECKCTEAVGSLSAELAGLLRSLTCRVIASLVRCTFPRLRALSEGGTPALSSRLVNQLHTIKK